MTNTLMNDEIYAMFNKELDGSDLKAAYLLAKISSMIVKFRVKNNMTQKDLAQFLGVSQSMISKYEGRNYNYSIETLCKIFSKMNLDFDLNITEIDSKPEDKRK